MANRKLYLPASPRPGEARLMERLQPDRRRPAIPLRGHPRPRRGHGTHPLPQAAQRPQLEVADVFREHGDAFFDQHGDTLSREQRRALHDIAVCRTAELGGHVEECDSCGHQQIAYNSCRNRHCPKCQATAAAQWMEARESELLPVEYFRGSSLNSTVICCIP